MNALIRLRCLSFILIVILISFSAQAQGIYRNGVGARAQSMAGADVADADDPLGAMAANPAGLALLDSPLANVGAQVESARGQFTNSVNNNAPLSSTPGALPDEAIGIPLGSSRFVVGVSVIPEAAMTADWKYSDPPGGLDGTSYGLQTNKSSILVVRPALGIGYSWAHKLYIGATIGLIDNTNTLITPYVFQTQPTLKGFKTLLNLNTNGLGWNGSVGLLFRAGANLQLGVATEGVVKVRSYGTASGNAAQQLNTIDVSFPPAFDYDAEVINHFPQMVKWGLSWNAFHGLRLAPEVDWIDWSSAFHELPVILTNGSNTDINALVGSTSLTDYIPLLWSNQFVYRLGVEKAISEKVLLRTGYSYGKSPVPNSTLTPLTAVIPEQGWTAGVGYQRGRYHFDAAYRLDIPKDRQVGTSALLAGEYSGSRVNVTINSFTFTTSIRLGAPSQE